MKYGIIMYIFQCLEVCILLFLRKNKNFLLLILFSLFFLISRSFYITGYILDNDEILAFRMVDNFYEYFIKDIHLFIYDYAIVGLFSLVFGKNIIILRFFNIFISLLTVYIVGDFLSKRFSFKTSYLFYLFYLFSPFFVFYSVYTESYTTSLFVISVFLRIVLVEDVKK